MKFVFHMGLDDVIGWGIIIIFLLFLAIVFIWDWIDKKITAFKNKRKKKKEENKENE